MTIIPDDAGLGDLLKRTTTIALIGASPKEVRPSHIVMAYLQKAGYRVVPVNPGQEGREILGERVYARLTDLPMAVDMVDIFRRAEFVPELVQQAIDIKAKSVWMQLGIRHEEAARTAAEAGLDVVMDRCTKIEHERLIG